MVGTRFNANGKRANGYKKQEVVRYFFDLFYERVIKTGENGKMQVGMFDSWHYDTLCDECKAIEVTEADLPYLKKPDGEWEFRVPDAGDVIVFVNVTDGVYDGHGVVAETSAGGHSAWSLSGYRWCKPRKASQTPWEMSDVPPVCWLREKGAGPRFSVMKITAIGITLFEYGHVCYESALENLEHSTDLKTWKPCTKEALD